MAKIPPAISSRMPAVNSRRADNCSILGIPLCAKIVLHPVDVPGTNCNVPQGLSHCSGRHWCIQRHQKQCRPHLVGNIVFRHTTAFFFCRRSAAQFLDCDYKWKFSQNCLCRTLFRHNNKLKSRRFVTFEKTGRIFSRFSHRFYLVLPQPFYNTFLKVLFESYNWSCKTNQQNNSRNS